MTKSILVIHPDGQYTDRLRNQLLSLNPASSRIEICPSLEAAMAVEEADFDLIFAGVPVTSIGETSPLRQLRTRFAQAILIILLEEDDLDSYVYAISQGAEEMLVRGNVDDTVLSRTISLARERNAATLALKTRLDEYRRHFDNGPIPMWIVDDKTMRFLFVNKAAVEKYGYTKEEFAEMTLLDIRPPEDAARTVEHYANSEAIYYDAGYWRHRKRNGNIFFVHVYSHRILFRNIEARLAFIVDVNDKLAAEKKNKDLMALTMAQKEQLDDILSSINQAIWSRNAATNELLYGNDAYYELYGYKTGDPNLKRNLDINKIHPDDRETLLAAIREVKSSGRVEYTYRYLNDDGSIKVLKGKAVFRKGINGKPDTVDGISSDVTVEKILYDEIRNSEQKLLTTINNTRDLIWSVDGNLKIIFCNRPFQDFFRKWFGVSLDEGDYVLGKWHSAEFIAQRKHDYERALSGESFTTVVQEDLEGGPYYFEINSTPIIGVDEKIIGVNCVSRDITKEQKQSIRINEQNERLREIAWLQSHKMRGPVARVLGLISLLDEKNPGSPENMDLISKLHLTTQELDDAIREIVDKSAEIG